MEDYKNLKSLRLAMGLNRVEFCKKYDIPYRTVSDWEAGRRKMPDYLFKLIKEHVDCIEKQKTEFYVFFIEQEAERRGVNPVDVYTELMKNQKLPDSNEITRKILLQKKFARIINLYAQEMHIPVKEAFDVFYSSQLYQLMSEGVSDLHAMSDMYLVDELIMEVRGY